jgi:hypothetical protein
VTVSEDADGYGPRPRQTQLERLLEDARTLSPAGVERVAAGWDAHGGARLKHSEQAALRVVEETGRGPQWDELRNRLLGLTERGEPLVAWRAAHGPIGHKAEDALLTAALAITTGETLDHADREALLRPMAEALPWLL